MPAVRQPSWREPTKTSDAHRDLGLRITGDEQHRQARCPGVAAANITSTVAIVAVGELPRQMPS